VGGTIAALALGCLALVVAPQVAATANGSHQTQATLAAGIAARGALLPLATTIKSVSAEPKAAVTPTAACTSARQALAEARAKDKDEDAAERAAATSDPNFKTTDAAEDKAEMAALKPLLDAVRTACGLTRPAPSAQCTAALQAAKAAFAADRTEDAAEKSAGTEGTAADEAEDKAERAQLGALWNSIRTACGFATFDPTHTTSFSWTGWHH
jgi:SWI/SNF-related matrix-associated actin-dependent regulator 1 of chromatin subfamily A